VTVASPDVVRWGFLGAGFVATQALAPAVHASGHACLQSVAARDQRRATALEPEGRATTSYLDILDDDEVDAVYISLTNEVHLLWIVAALERGKHVLCEKPITLTADECRTAFSAARAAGRLLVEAAWTQWHPRTRRLDTLVGQGDLGPVREITASFTFSGVPEGNYRLDPARGGGAVLDVGPYLLRPAAAWVAGEWTLDAVSTDMSPRGVDLRTRAELSAASGAQTQVTASLIDPEHQVLVVTGDTAAAEYGSPAFTSWQAPATLHLIQGDRAWSETFPSCDAYELMVSAVSRRISGDHDSFVVSEDESVRCMSLIDLVRDAERPQ
jgi:predicted dehydrogenase